VALAALRPRIDRALDAAGIVINGPNPWDPQVHDGRVFRRVLLHGAIGLGDAYVDGWWDCAALDRLFDRALRAGLPSRLWWTPPVLGAWLGERVFNRQTRPRAGRSVRAHYDLGNDLFEAMLDSRMVYSCALWDGAATLEEAQEAKLELICRKLGLQEGMTLLDIGCGWGGLAAFAAERFGTSVVGVTLSPEQAALARERCRGLPVKILLRDYREVRGRFDRVVSVGMFEHVGPKNYVAFMRALRDALADDGASLLHTIGTQRPWPSLKDPELLWHRRHIFPGAAIPSMSQITAAAEGLLVLEDVENIGPHYDPTLMAWHANVERAWPGLRDRLGERFSRLWTYYLRSAAGVFRSRKYQVWQIVLSPRGVCGGYRRPDRARAGAAEPPRVVARARPEQRARA
jgi:cyclopropane-fatty-acyl-phospholipid synthase